MTLKEFNELIVPIINLIFTTSGIVTVIIMVYQYRMDAKWNKLQSKFNFIDLADSAAIQEKLYHVLEKIKCYSFPEDCVPLSESNINEILSNREYTFVTNMFLNDLNNICIALKFDLLNENVFKSSHVGRILWWYEILLPYIKACQTRYRNPEIWIDFVSTAEKYRLDRIPKNVIIDEAI